MTPEDRFSALEARVGELEKDLAGARAWMSVMYADMLRLQHSAAKAIAGDRDGANEIYLAVQKNSKLLTPGKKDE